MTKRVCAVVDIEAIKHNINEVKNKTGLPVMAVIKTDAYGHGALSTANALSGIASAFAVAATDEALELRRAGTKEMILILGGIPEEEIAQCIENEISMTVYDIDMAHSVSDNAKRLSKTAKIHIAVDTGMSRIGYLPTDESASEIKKISKLPGIKIEGIFTHYATADMSDKTFSETQKKRFFNICEQLKGMGVDIGIRHIANSAAIMDFPEYGGEMVRSGIITYGLLPSSEVNKNALDLKPALEWKSRVSYVKTVDKSIGISYGLTYVTDEKKKIATVSAGYGDGYPRSLSNKGRVLINGKSFNIVGRVCMDQFMVDVTGADVRVDDEVTLIGKNGDDYISADEIAQLSGTINYEVVCNVSKRVPRIYKGENNVNIL